MKLIHLIIIFLNFHRLFNVARVNDSTNFV